MRLNIWKSKVLRDEQDEITVRISLGRGDACETVWTTDLSHDYVRSTQITEAK